MRRLLKTLALMGLMVPTLAQALGLGDIDVRSALNQPLHAEIEVVSVAPGEMDALRIGLASSEMYGRIGIDRTPLLDGLRFRPVVRDGRYFVMVVTEAAVSEPFLNFLIEAEWPGGRLVREYTILLDPPLLHEQRRAVTGRPPVVEAPAPAPRRVREEAPRPAAPAPEARPAAAGTLEPGRDRYAVAADDTLSKVARMVDTDAGINQTMIALQQENPDAFIEGNINLLKKGQVLRIPDRGTITGIRREQAAAEVARQQAVWRELRRRGPVSAAPQEPLPPVAATPDPKEETAPPALDPAPLEGRLEIIAPSVAPEMAAPVPMDASATAEETLQARIRELEGTLENRERMLLVLNEQLAELQRRLAGIEARMEAPPDAAAAAEPSSPSPRAAAPTPAQEEPAGLLDELRANPNLLAALGVIVLLLITLVWILARRGRREVQTLGSTAAAATTTPLPTAVAASASTVTAATGSVEEEDGGGVGGHAREDADMGEEMPEIGIEGAQEDRQFVNDDTVAEADVFLAYGLYSQAEDLLTRALAEHPTRNGYRQKLLETLFAARKPEAFEAAAREFLERLGGDRSSPAWRNVADMGRQIDPANALYGAAEDLAAPEPARASFAREETGMGLLDEEATGESVLATPAEGPEIQPEPSQDIDFEKLLFDEAAEDALAAQDLGEEEREIPETEKFSPALPDIELEPGEPVFEGPSPGEIEALREPPLLESEHDLSAIELDAAGFARQEEVDEAALESLFSDLAFDEGEDGVAAAAEEGRSGDEAIPDALSGDEVDTKLDLARAYVEMGDDEGARAALEEILQEGNDRQKAEAERQLAQLG